MLDGRARWVGGALLGSGVAGLAYWRAALSGTGALAAAAIGWIVLAQGGLAAAAALLAFFGSSSALSRLGESRKRSLPMAQAKGARRDAWQVLANGGVAALCLLARRPTAALGALAAASADTWATELGLLARRSPRSITTLRIVPPGTSGAITPEGLLASVGGSAVVGISYTLVTRRPSSIATAIGAGVAGALADSVVGAIFQAEYWCPVCTSPTEDAIHAPCGTRASLRRGKPWITNDVVNVLATLVGACLATVLGTPGTAGHVRGGS